MRVEQQMRLLVLLSLFSLGICVTADYYPSHAKDDRASYKNARECEQRENQECAESELHSALAVWDDVDIHLNRLMGSVLEEVILGPGQPRFCAVGSRAPPLWNC